MTSRHVRPAVPDQRAVLAVTRAVLDADQAAAHDAAAPPGTCPQCTVVAAVHLGIAIAQSMAGVPLMTDELHAHLLKMVETVEDGLREAGN
jgi:hypothetical protein